MSKSAYETDPRSGYKVFKNDSMKGLDFEYYYSLCMDLEPAPAFEVAWLDSDGKTLVGNKYDVPPENVTKVKADPDDVWFWKFRIALDRGGSFVRITGKQDGKTIVVHTIEIAPPSNAPGQTQVRHFAPHVYEAISKHTVVPGEKKHLSGDFTAVQLKEVLQHIWGRLRTGLSRTWLGPSETFNEGWFRYELASDDGVKKEEQWARTVAGMLTFYPYSALLSAMKIHSDDQVFAKMQDKADPAYPVMSACQQLVTMATIARGYRFEVENGRTKNTFDASIVGFGAAMQRVGGKWYEGKNTINPDTGVVCGPGSVFAYDKDIGRHIGFIIRTMPEKGLFQTFDTGALNCRAVVSDVTIHEDAWRKDRAPWLLAYNKDGEVKTKTMSVSIGNVPSAPASNGANVTDLADAVKHVRKARPLGFARLVILRRGAGNAPYEVLYASPLLRMHTDEEGVNFSSALYLWSIRQVPYKESVQALWLIYTPLFGLAYAMMGDNSRSKTLAQLLKVTKDNYKAEKNYPDQSKYPPEGDGLPVDTWIKDVLYLYSELDRPEDDGFAYVLARRVNNPEKKTFNYTEIHDNNLFDLSARKMPRTHFPGVSPPGR